MKGGHGRPEAGFIRDLFALAAFLVALAAAAAEAEGGGAEGATAVPSAAAAGTSSVTAVLAAPSSPSRYRLRLDGSYNSSLHSPQSHQRKSDATVIIEPSVRLNERFKLSSASTVSQDFADPAQKTTFSNTRLSFSHAPIQLHPLVKLGAALVGTLPTDRFAVEDETYQGAVGTSTRLLFDLAPIHLPLNGYVGVNYDRNFHRYNINSSGSPNLRERIKEYAVLQLPISSRWDVSVSGTFVSAWTYRSFVRNRFELSEEIGYTLNPETRFYLGHGNMGQAFKANGHDTNITLFDQHDSMLSVGASYLF